jgi:alpha-galactosidase
MRNGIGAVLHLRANGTSLVVDAAGQVPEVLHWGAGLGPLSDADLLSLRATAEAAVLNNAPDSPRRFSVWPGEQDGWEGTSAQDGQLTGRAPAARPRAERVQFQSDGEDGGCVAIELVEDDLGLTGVIRFTMDRFGVITVERELTKTSDDPFAAHDYTVLALRALMPLPERATDLLDFTGKWCRERAPQRGTIRFGSHARRSRRGKPGHDAPFLMVAGTADLSFSRGEAWAVHLAWSGDAEYLVERLPEGAGVHSSVLGVGESLRAGEVVLAVGDRYVAPPAVFVWSGGGLDGVSDRLHRRLRARPGHPGTPRPLTLNTWEAVYFDHDLDELTRLVDRAEEVGVERVVLDDGWFTGRRDATAGLGDWTVDVDVWPDGLTPLVNLVHGKGMQFGLWFEPEMINPDSRLARLHPEWIIGPRSGVGTTARGQHVLDIGNTDAYSYVLEAVSAIVSTYDVDYIKWDHNRDLVEPVAFRAGAERPVVHEQVDALYRLMDELRRRHPQLEIETCSGGGGRVDLGILDRTDRVWPSDTNDPVERIRIERWTRMLLPPELIGSHVGAERAHTTGRRTDLTFRLIASLTAHAGIEWNLQQATGKEMSRIRAWADLYKELRTLMHSGRVVNADLADDGALLTGIIAADGGRAVFTWARTHTSATGQAGRIRFPGLLAEHCYSIRLRDELGETSTHQVLEPSWLAVARSGGAELSGSVLGSVGVPLPTLNPQQAMLFDLTRIA